MEPNNGKQKSINTFLGFPIVKSLFTALMIELLWRFENGGFWRYTFGMFDFKAVLFDLDGTILNTIGDINAALNKALGTNFTNEECKGFIGNGLKNAIKAAVQYANLKDINLDDTFYRLVEFYKLSPVKYTTPFPGVQDFFDELEKRNIAIGVFSNKEQELAQTIIHRCFPNTKFAMIIGMHGGYEPKPSAQAVLAFCKEVGYSIDELLYVGDSEVDYQTALNAGAKMRILTWGTRTREQLMAKGVPAVVLIDKL